MKLLDREETETLFRRAGLARNSSTHGVFENKWTNALWQLNRAWGVTATWDSDERHAEAWSDERRYVAPFPVDAHTFAVCAHELAHIIRQDQQRDDWPTELAADDWLLFFLEALGDFTEQDLADITWKLSTGLNFKDATRSEVESSCQHRDLLFWHSLEFRSDAWSATGVLEIPGPRV